MGREDYEIFRELRQERIKEGADRREANKGYFKQALQLATQAGMTLIQHSEVHYSLESPPGWRLNIYPGNRRLYHDRKHVKPPFLKVKPDWNLLDIVRAAIAATNTTNADQFAKEIEASTSIVSDADIGVRAYYLWEAAGRPDGDDQKYWLQAEKEMRG